MVALKALVAFGKKDSIEATVAGDVVNSLTTCVATVLVSTVVIRDICLVVKLCTSTIRSVFTDGIEQGFSLAGPKSFSNK